MTDISLSGLISLKRDLLKDDQRVLAAANVAINHGASVAYRRAIDEAARQYVLTPSYIRKHLVLQPSGRNGVEARVVGTHRGTLIDRFKKPRNITAPVKHPRRSMGNPRAGIARGRKMAGAVTEVRRGNPYRWRSAFWIPLNRGRSTGGNGMALARRTGAGRGDFEVIHTISVGQIWRRLRDEMQPDIQQAVETEFERLLSR